MNLEKRKGVVGDLEVQECKESRMELYTITDLQTILHIGKNTAYKIAKLKGFPTIQIGKKILIPKEDFNQWMQNNIGKQIDI